MHKSVPKVYCFVKQFDTTELQTINKSIGIIYRNYDKKVNEKTIILLKNYCKKKKSKIIHSQ
jgi:thiamine-phosphate pyrophosphorylase